MGARWVLHDIIVLGEELVAMACREDDTGNHDGTNHVKLSLEGEGATHTQDHMQQENNMGDQTKS